MPWETRVSLEAVVFRWVFATQRSRSNRVCMSDVFVGRSDRIQIVFETVWVTLLRGVLCEWVQVAMDDAWMTHHKSCHTDVQRLLVGMLPAWCRPLTSLNTPSSCGRRHALRPCVPVKASNAPVLCLRSCDPQCFFPSPGKCPTHGQRSVFLLTFSNVLT